MYRPPECVSRMNHHGRGGKEVQQIKCPAHSHEHPVHCANKRRVTTARPFVESSLLVENVGLEQCQRDVSPSLLHRIHRPPSGRCAINLAWNRSSASRTSGPFVQFPGQVDVDQLRHSAENLPELAPLRIGKRERSRGR